VRVMEWNEIVNKIVNKRYGADMMPIQGIEDT
jgi:hypothetical protein